MDSIDRLKKLKAEIPDCVQIVAVSKFKPAFEIENLFNNTGHRLYGENRSQEFVEKAANLPKELEWHFIGHLQSNKVKPVIQYAAVIQSVDSFRLLSEINKQAANTGKVQDCLLQIFIAKEESKFGFSPDELNFMLNDKAFHDLQNVKICGLMGMATLTDDHSQVANEFRNLNHTFESLKKSYFKDSTEFKILSMGMTDDYQIAINEGSNMIRVGAGIFGSR